jgi:hypothetical protein
MEQGAAGMRQIVKCEGVYSQQSCRISMVFWGFVVWFVCGLGMNPGQADRTPPDSAITPLIQAPVTDRIPFYTEHRTADWKPAFWIHCQAANEEKHPYSLFRREFDLSSLPASAVLHVATDDRYRVWVNGTLVANGSTPHDYVHMSYESYEIALLLKTGTNTLAFDVLTYAPERAISEEHKIPSGIMTAVLAVSQDRISYRTLVAL